MLFMEGPHAGLWHSRSIIRGCSCLLCNQSTLLLLNTDLDYTKLEGKEVIMSALFRVGLFSAFFLLCTSAVDAHVVIDRIRSGDSDLKAPSKQREQRNRRATGKIDKVKSSELSGKLDFKAPATRTPSQPARGNQNTSKVNQLDRFPRTRNASQNLRASGGNRNRGRASQGRGNRNIVQRVVIVSNNSPAATNNSASNGPDVTVFVSNTPVGSRSSGSGSGSGSASGTGAGTGGGGRGTPGSDPNSEPLPNSESTPNSPSSRITGTPEPSSLVVWTITACCGYGVVRLRRRQESC